MPEATIPDFPFFEEWRTISDFPDYAVSRSGYVKRIRPDRKGRLSGSALRPSRHYKCGHLIVKLVDAIGKIHYRYVHTLVAQEFIGPRPSPKHEVAHWDNHADNNHYTNLRWATRKENIADRIRHETNFVGERHPMSKVSAVQVDEIRRQLLSGRTGRSLAMEYGLGPSQISRIKRDEHWRDSGKRLGHTTEVAT